jgi:hypothetical protein
MIRRNPIPKPHVAEQALIPIIRSTHPDPSIRPNEGKRDPTRKTSRFSATC